MHTTHTTRTTRRSITSVLAAVAAGAAFPMVLFAGAGAAHADPQDTWEPRVPGNEFAIPTPTPPRQIGDLAGQTGDPLADVSVDQCQVQNDGSTWCNYYVDGKLATHGCFSDWDGQDCNGDEKED